MNKQIVMQVSNNKEQAMRSSCQESAWFEPVFRGFEPNSRRTKSNH